MLQDMQQTGFGSEEVSKIDFINFIKGGVQKIVSDKKYTDGT